MDKPFSDVAIPSDKLLSAKPHSQNAREIQKKSPKMGFLVGHSRLFRLIDIMI